MRILTLLTCSAALLIVSAAQGTEAKSAKRGVETSVSVDAGPQQSVLLDAEPSGGKVARGEARVCNRSASNTGNFFSLEQEPGGFSMPETMYMLPAGECRSVTDVWGVQFGAMGGPWTATVVFN